MRINVQKRLKKLRETALKNVERGFTELDLIFQKENKIETGVIDTGKLRQLIQATKDLTELYKDENSGKEDISLVLKALEGEENDP
ncbi:MAG: hypothetical protein R3Y35_02465 [Clostridia bacterium]